MRVQAADGFSLTNVLDAVYTGCCSEAGHYLEAEAFRLRKSILEIGANFFYWFWEFYKRGAVSNTHKTLNSFN